jgi:hypothetical protein
LETHIETVRKAIAVVLRHLESLPPSDGKQQLRGLVQDCLREADGWATTRPADREREALMKRLLALHVAVTRLEREREVAVA